MRVLLNALVCLAAAACCCASTIELNHEFSGAYEPEGTPPWLTAEFTTISPGTVELRMAATNLIDNEYVGIWQFNLAPTLDPTSLVITYDSGTAAKTILVGTDAFKADGDGWYDIFFDFPQAAAARFGAGDVSIYRITGIAGLNQYDFLYLSKPGGDNGTWTSAAHVQGIGDADQYSGWIGGITHAPEPSPALLFGTGLTLVAVGAFIRSRKRKAAAASR